MLAGDLLIDPVLLLKTGNVVLGHDVHVAARRNATLAARVRVDGARNSGCVKCRATRKRRITGRCHRRRILAGLIWLSGHPPECGFPANAALPSAHDNTIAELIVNFFILIIRTNFCRVSGPPRKSGFVLRPRSLSSYQDLDSFF